jgi:hypothetical protein
MATRVTDQTLDPGGALASPDSSAAAQPWTQARAAWLALGAVGLLAVLVFWAFEALPFQDLPAHAGLIAMRHRFEASAFEQRFYVLSPHIGPYSLFRFLGEAFHRVLGPVGAVRALATLPVLATPMALLFARRRLFGDRSPTHGFLGLALSFGFMTLLGFASYLLGVAIMLVVLTLWLELLAVVDDRAPAAGRRELLVALAAPVVFVAHGHAFLLFLLCAAIATVASGRRLARVLRLRALLPSLALAGWVAWIERTGTAPPGSVPFPPRLAPVFQGPAQKFELLVTPTLMTRSGIDFFVAIALWGLTIACTFFTVRALLRSRSAEPRPAAPPGERHARALLLSALAVTVLFLALPHSVGWFGFVDGRLVPLILLLALLAVGRPALPRPLSFTLDAGAPVIACTIASLALVSSYSFQDEARGYREVLARVPADSTLLNLPLDPNSDVFTAHPFIHYDKLVLADRPVVVSDVWFHQGSALYPTPENPALRLPQTYRESDLRTIDWPAYRLEDWDFVLIRTRVGAPEPFTPAALELDRQAGGWWLFKHARPAS